MDDILDLLSDSFSNVFEWTYDLIFDDLFSSIKDTGVSISNKFESVVCSDDIIYYVIGIGVFTFIVHLVVSIIRG